ncbi:hypothetical protein TRFO_21436 [Tritrichomonas foetus]|uniref:E3 ubiquitin-protein ligase n=1 Tax=Tritrichomonas foetus TaxID=1144522 RepID=A0A1J4KEK0_9EUKA|nr:hypothetical protein TRFO_21436 [Tritrichomonas foetus]|eukprot:OHT09627.1 hypothetical protein TRFO_21436 [Tritrichomonas foetus]
MNSNLYAKLFQLFSNDTRQGIEEAEKILYEPAYPDFMSYLKAFSLTQNSSMCPASWTDTICAKCFDCQLASNACVCLPCFIAGHHEEHHSILQISSGTCDCGNPLFLKPEGNCPHHQGCVEHPDTEYLKQEERSIYLTIFKAAMDASFKSSTIDLAPILKWLIRFIEVGDSLRRLLSIAFCDVDQESIVLTIRRGNEEEAELYSQLVTRLISDTYFLNHYGVFVHSHFAEFFKDLCKAPTSDDVDIDSPPYYGLRQFLINSFHVFAKHPVEYNMKNGSYDPEITISDYFQNILNILKGNYNDDIFMKLTLIEHSWIFLETVDLLSNSGDTDRLNGIVLKMIPVLSEFEKLLLYTIPAIPEDDDYQSFQFTSFALMSNLFSLFKKMVSVKLDIHPVFKALLELNLNDPELKENQSVFKPGKPIKTCMPLTLLFWMILESYKDEIPTVLEDLCKENNISLDDFIILASTYPIRLFAFLRNFHYFVKYMSPQNSRGIMIFMIFPFKFPNQIFLAVQYSFALIHDTERFLRLVASSFGILDYETKEQNEQQQQQQNEMQPTAAFLQFVGSLWLDRILASNDTLALQRNIIISSLLADNRTAETLESSIPGFLKEPKVADELLSIAERITTSRGSMFKLKNDEGFHFFMPWIRPDYLSQAISKHERKVFYFPSSNEFLYGLKFPTFSKIIMSVILSTLSDFRDTSSTCIAEAMLILFCQLNKNNLNSEKICDIPSFDDELILISALSEVANHENFMNIKLHGKTIIDLVLNDTKNGELVLQKCEIVQNSVGKPKSNSLKKQIASETKKKIMEEFLMKQQSFGNQLGDSNSGQIEESGNLEQICPVCGEVMNDEALYGYPAMICPSFASQIAQTKIDGNSWELKDENKIIQGLTICNHPMHINCRQGNVFGCPMCNLIRTIIIPVIPTKFNEEPNKAVNQAIERFFDEQVLVKETKTASNIISMLSSYIQLTEIRLRTRPDVLDHIAVKVIIPNVFKTLYFFLKQHTNLIAENMSEADESFILFLYELIQSNDILNESKEIVRRFAEKETGTRHFEFLRRAAILLHFGLDQSLVDNNTKFIDWDDILSYKSLGNIFEIEISENDAKMELKPFQAPPLADKFICNFQPPYEYNIFDTKNSYWLDMMTGNVFHADNIFSYIQKYYNIASSMFLILSGQDCSTVVVFCPFLRKLFRVKGFYVDQFGDEDPQYAKGAVTRLSQDRLEDAIDNYMTLDYINIPFN